MANSGGTNSNGSQFYITLSPQPELNGNYTVFGSVVSGLNVVTNIGAVAVDANSKPLVPVVMNSVTILRIGTAASNFSATTVTPPLPAPAIKATRIVPATGHLLLQWNALANDEYRICYSGDLAIWHGSYLGAYSGVYLDSFTSSLAWQFFVTVESKID